MLARMLGAVRMNVDTYEDVEDDRSATWQAMAVVVIVSLCAAAGVLIQELLAEGDADFVRPILGGVTRGILWWAIWALFTWLVGSTLLKTPETVADWGQLARGTGFAQAPGIFSLLVFLPGVVGPLILLLAFIWQVACMIIAIRQCLDYKSTWRAFFVALIAVIPAGILFAILVNVIGVNA